MMRIDGIHICFVLFGFDSNKEIKMHETIGQSQIYPISIDMNNDHFDLIIDERIEN